MNWGRVHIFMKDFIQQLTPKEIRSLIRKGKWHKPTAGLAMGYAQANLVILPQKYAFDFLLFCQRNPKPCPLLEVLEPGKYLQFTKTSKTWLLLWEGIMNRIWILEK